MPKVFLFGYYGFGNLGDELLCDYYINLFRNHFPGLQLVVLKEKQPIVPGDEPPYTVANRWNLWRLGRMMDPGDLLVGGGGSIFQDATSKRSLLYYLALLRLAQRRGVAIILSGQGIGPLSSWGRRLARPVLNRARLIGCRDHQSLQLLADMTVDRPQLYLGVDPVWDYPCPVARLGVSGQRGRRRPGIGYILRAGGSRKKKHLLLSLKSLFPDLQLITLSPADEEAAHKFAEELGLMPPWCIREPAAFFRLASELTVVLSERLHGLVLAARSRLPGIGLGADPKLHAFCHQMNWSCWTWSDPALAIGVCTELKKIWADPVGTYQQVRRQAEIMEGKGEEDRQWLLNQLAAVLAGE